MAEAMERCDRVQTRAAEILGMTFRSFRYFAKKYGLTRGEAPVGLDAGPTDETDVDLPGVVPAADTQAGPIGR
jgi:hypothetical protein